MQYKIFLRYFHAIAFYAITFLMIDRIGCHLPCESHYTFYAIAFLTVNYISNCLPSVMFFTPLLFS